MPFALVRHGILRQLRPYTTTQALAPGGACVVETSRGVELGRALAIVERANEPAAGRVLRLADPEDLARAALQSRLCRDRDLPRARDLLSDAGADGVRAIAAERMLEGPRLVLHFSAREWVDVPRLLIALGPVFAQDGLELHLEQLGARARASACGGAGGCGRTLCCSTFLRRLDPVTVRMAQVQGVASRPEQTAGLCGRLKCCLRYESPLYEDNRRGLPREGWQVVARRAQGTVQAIDVLRKKVLVRTSTGSFVRLFAEEIERSGPPPRAPLPLAHEPPPPPPPQPPERGWSFLSRRWWRRAPPPEPQEEEQKE